MRQVREPRFNARTFIVGRHNLKPITTRKVIENEVNKECDILGIHDVKSREEVLNWRMGKGSWPGWPTKHGLTMGGFHIRTLKAPCLYFSLKQQELLKFVLSGGEKSNVREQFRKNNK